MTLTNVSVLETSRLSCDVIESGGVDILRLSGRIDFDAAQAMHARFEGLLRDGRSRFLLDLAAIARVDSTGLSLMVGLLKTARASGGELALLNVNPTILELLELVKLHQLFDIYQDRDLALRRLAA